MPVVTFTAIGLGEEPLSGRPMELFAIGVFATRVGVLDGASEGQSEGMSAVSEGVLDGT